MQRRRRSVYRQPVYAIALFYRELCAVPLHEPVSDVFDDSLLDRELDELTRTRRKLDQLDAAVVSRFRQNGLTFVATFPTGSKRYVGKSKVNNWSPALGGIRVETTPCARSMRRRVERRRLQRGT